MKQVKGLMAIVVLVVAVLSVQGVDAHATLVTSDPPEDSVIPTTPDEIRLTFDKEIDPERSSAELVNASGSTIAEGGADLDDPDRVSMTIELPEDVPPGEYTVTWTVVEAQEAEQHEVEGQYAFTIDPTATATSSPTVVLEAPEGTVEPLEDALPADDDDDDGGLGRGTIIVGAVSILVALAVVASIGRRRWWR